MLNHYHKAETASPMGFAQGLVYRTSESGEKGMMETSTDHVQRVVGRKREKGTSLDFFHPRFPYN